MTRKIKAITEELCSHEFSASAISEMNVKLDGELERFARRALEAEFPYLILDARYEKVREECVIRSRAVLVAIGIVWEGRRQILALEIANRESTTSWRELLLSLKQRGLGGVRRAISDDHAGLKRALAEVLPKACRQRCYVHFLRNALDPLPRKVGDDCRSGDLQSALRVKCLAPGGFFNHQPEPLLTPYKEYTMLGRMADERDLGGAVIFFLSDAAKYVTGANLPVDGGYTAK